MNESFLDTLNKFKKSGFVSLLEKSSGIDIKEVLSRDFIDEISFLALLSDNSDDSLELAARRAKELTVRNFGKVIHLYAPLYLGNFCDNDCLYCGFKRSNNIQRKKLSLQDVEKEAGVISSWGMRHILVLTGESRLLTPLSYIKECLDVLKRYFDSVSIEIYPLDIQEYGELVDSGVDGLTIYQETYDEELYRNLHKDGPKSDYLWRLNAPERACQADIRTLSIAALLGLGNFYEDVFFTGLHAFYLQNKYPEVELSVSLPRLQPQTGNFFPPNEVSDKQLVRALVALRIFLPRAGINISTRENSILRSNLISLGVTRMSAGSRTGVGGYSLDDKSDGQFETADKSNVEEVSGMIRAKGYQPVFKDWQRLK